MKPIIFAAALAAACTHTPKDFTQKPADVVSLGDVDPTIVIEARYVTDHNFVGKPIDGYEAPLCLLTRPAAEGLKKAQADLAPFGFSLKVYDCYRPQRAVQNFVAWAEDVEEIDMKGEFYPNVDKTNLFKDGYIAERSGHSRASTVDLTIVPKGSKPKRVYKAGESLVDCRAPQTKRFPDDSLDMGTGYDCFDPKSHTAHAQLDQAQRANRLLLKSVLEKHGFENYDKEWWHFTLKNEPYPDTFFDFPVK